MNTTPEIIDRTRKMRKEPTEEENKLWHILLKHVKPRFIRQKTIGYYIVDFYCPKLKLIIEIDGEQHFSSTGGWNDENNLMLVKKRDKVKNEQALSHNIPLVRIPYWERDNITLEMIMGDKYLVRETD